MLVGDRDRLAVYPEFVLSALVLSPASARRLQAPIEEAARRAMIVYQSQAFRHFNQALEAAFLEVGSRDVVKLARCIASVDEAAIQELRAEVSKCLGALAESSIRLEIELGLVKDVDDGYAVEILGKTERYPVANALQLLAPGDLVTRDRVRVASAEQVFLLPVPERIVSHDSGMADEEEFLSSLMEGLDGYLRDIPELPPSRVAFDTATADLDVPWHLLAGANSMSRGTRAAR